MYAYGNMPNDYGIKSSIVRCSKNTASSLNLRFHFLEYDYKCSFCKLGSLAILRLCLKLGTSNSS